VPDGQLRPEQDHDLPEIKPACLRARQLRAQNIRNKYQIIQPIFYNSYSIIAFDQLELTIQCALNSKISLEF